MKLAKVFALTLACAAATTAAHANDSSAELSQGGLVLKKHDGIAMKSEDLFVSPSAIKVRYVFQNTSGHDQKTIVAFPMPDITTEGVDDLIAIPSKDPVNFLQFHTTVDGQPVKAQVEQRVFKGGYEQTAILKRLGVPLAPHLDITRKALDRLSAPEKAHLLKLGLVVPDDYDAGKGPEHHLGPAWTLKTTYWWEQTFPAGKPVHVEHAYKPSVGESSGTSLENKDFRSDKYGQAYRAKYCIDEAFLAAVDTRRAAVGPNRQAFFEKRIDYILKTGANWSQPIGDFRLTLDKGSEASLISVCEKGLTKLSPTRFELHRANFTPDHDLHVLILVPAPNGY
jgi:hypothetical protein